MQRSNKNTFTFIELLTTMVVVAILAVLAVPRFDIVYDIKVNGAAKKIVADIRYVQSVAIARHTDTRIVFDTGTDTYQADYYTDSATWNPVTDPFTRGDLSTDFDTHTQYGGIDISSVDFGGTNTLMFNREGQPESQGGSDRSASVTITYKGTAITVNVASQTGKVTTS